MGPNPDRNRTEPESIELSPAGAYRTIDLNGEERLAEFNKSFGYLWRFQRTDWNYSQWVQKIKWHYFRGCRWYFIPSQRTILKSGGRKSINIEILWLLLSQNWWPTMDRRCPVDDGRESYSSRRILFLWRIIWFWNLFWKTENETDWSKYLSLEYYLVHYGMTHFNDSCDTDHTCDYNFIFRISSMTKMNGKIALSLPISKTGSIIIGLAIAMIHSLWIISYDNWQNRWWSRLKTKVKVENIINGFPQKVQYQERFQKVTVSNRIFWADKEGYRSK